MVDVPSIRRSRAEDVLQDMLQDMLQMVARERVTRHGVTMQVTWAHS